MTKVDLRTFEVSLQIYFALNGLFIDSNTLYFLLLNIDCLALNRSNFSLYFCLLLCLLIM